MTTTAPASSKQPTLAESEAAACVAAAKRATDRLRELARVLPPIRESDVSHGLGAGVKDRVFETDLRRWQHIVATPSNVHNYNTDDIERWELLGVGTDRFVARPWAWTCPNCVDHPGFGPGDGEACEACDGDEDLDAERAVTLGWTWKAGEGWQFVSLLLTVDASDAVGWSVYDRENDEWISSRGDDYVPSYDDEDENGVGEAAQQGNVEYTRQNLHGFPFAHNYCWELDGAHHVEAFIAAGFLVYKYEDDNRECIVAGIDGGGYDFVSAHWVPLYLALATEHDWTVETEAGPRRVTVAPAE